MTETRIVNEILIALGGRPDMRVWRNNSGALVDERGRLVRFGLQGSADILGILAPTGRFLAIEAKTDRGRQTEQQRRFQAMVESMGGIYVLARSSQEAISGVESCIL